MMRPAVLLIGAIALFLAIRWQMQPGAVPPAQRGGDIALYAAVVTDLQRGQSYYEAMGTELRARHYHMRPVFTWREPLVLMTVATLSAPFAQLVLIGLGGWLIWVTRGFPALTPWLLVNALIDVLIRPLVYYTEIWAGICLALSAVALTRQQRTAGVAWAILALSIRELAAPYCVGATLVAVWRREWPEVQRWALGGVLYAAYYGAHAWQVHTHLQSTDMADVRSWVALGGVDFVLHALFLAGAWIMLPVAIFSFAVVAAVAAWWAPGMPIHVRMGVLVYVGFFLIAGQPFNTYWGWMVGPLAALWLAHAPSGVTTLLVTDAHTRIVTPVSV
jgi:hypothetical protein